MILSFGPDQPIMLLFVPFNLHLIVNVMDSHQPCLDLHIWVSLSSEMTSCPFMSWF